ncbi:hypothetical protein [Listeria newyorkensis]|uniref:hypothetical protein n=1 Tax=Listeria newyorkensis TaxID=1497681 RepID=UPI00051D5307|nr:hypothetical protein [Listeria newyorkensis]KGL43631.1 hypothetical protein EP58_07795 [Listeria newyorkensis]
MRRALLQLLEFLVIAIVAGILYINVADKYVLWLAIKWLETWTPLSAPDREIAILSFRLFLVIGSVAVVFVLVIAIIHLDYAKLYHAMLEKIRGIRHTEEKDIQRALFSIFPFFLCFIGFILVGRVGSMMYVLGAILLLGILFTVWLAKATQATDNKRTLEADIARVKEQAGMLRGHVDIKTYEIAMQWLGDHIPKMQRKCEAMLPLYVYSKKERQEIQAHLTVLIELMEIVNQKGEWELSFYKRTREAIKDYFAPEQDIYLKPLTTWEHHLVYVNKVLFIVDFDLDGRLLGVSQAVYQVTPENKNVSIRGK